MVLEGEQGAAPDLNLDAKTEKARTLQLLCPVQASSSSGSAAGAQGFVTFFQSLPQVRTVLCGPVHQALALGEQPC